MLIGIFLYFLTSEKTEILGAIIATGISLSIGIRQYKTENDKIFKQLFTEFNSKYDTKFNDKLEEIVEKSKKKTKITNYLLNTKN